MQKLDVYVAHADDFAHRNKDFAINFKIFDEIFAKFLMKSVKSFKKILKWKKSKTANFEI